MKQWLTAAEIATAQLAGLPTVKRAVNRVAAAQSWRGKPRCGRGGGVEYHIDSLPVAARADYFARHLQAIDVPASVARDAAIEPQAEAVVGPATEARDARLALLAAADRYAVAARMGHKRADAHFCDRYNLGEIEIADWIKDEVKALSPRTLKRWRSLSRAGKRSQLAVDRGASRRNTGILDRANDGAVKTFALAVIVKQPQLTAHHIRALVADRFDGALLVGGRSISVPPVRTFQYALKAWRADNRVALEAARNPDGFKNTMRFAARVTSPASHLNEVWQIDASPADVMCVDGRHAIYVAIDVYSRRVIGLVSKTPRASAVGLLLRKCILTWGVPDRIKSDNGSDFIARETQRLFAGLAIEHEKARPFTPEQKGHVERVIGTLQRGLMRTLPGFVGHSVADRTVIRSRKSFADRLGEAADDTFQVELTGADLQAKVDNWCNVIYANAPHSSLKGQTPFAVAAMAGGPIRRIGDVRALDMLLMPVAGKDGVRTVTKTGLRIDGAHYIAGFLNVGDEVVVRMDPADMGRAYVYNLDQTDYLGEALCPELAGVDPSKAIAAARAEQKRLIDERMADAKRAARKIKAADMAPAMQRQAAREAGTLVEFPKAVETHDTPALAAGRAAIRDDATVPVHSADVIALQRQLIAEAAQPAKVAPLRVEETPHQRWRRARDMEAALARGDEIPSEQLLWLGGYRSGPEYRGFALTYGVTETKSPAEAGHQVAN